MFIIDGLRKYQQLFHSYAAWAGSVVFIPLYTVKTAINAGLFQILTATLCRPGMEILAGSGYI